MTLGPADRLFALRRVPAFADMPHASLVVLARLMEARDHAPGELLAPAGRVAEQLRVVVAGGAGTPAGEPVSPTIGLPGLLFGQVTARDVVAGPSGATTLALDRDHLLAAVQAHPSILAAVLAADPATFA